LFATVSILPHGLPRVFKSRDPISHRRSLGDVTEVSTLPLSLWLPSASGRDGCPPGLSHLGTSFLRRGLFVHSGEAVVRNRHHSPSRGPERFRELPSTLSVPDGPAACSGLQATPASLAPQCLWPRCLSARSLASSALPSCKGVLLLRSGAAVVRNRLFHPHGLPSVFESQRLIFTPGRAVWPDSGVQATPGSVASQCLWPCCFRQVSRRSERSPLGQVLLVHLGGAPVRRRPILPRGLRGVFESHTSCFSPDGAVA